MPPKADQDRAAKAQKKADQAKKAKNVEDKTFGLKNKNKSAKVQNYVQQLQKSVDANSKNNARLALQDPNSKEYKAKKKLEEEMRQKELNELFTAAIKQPKVPVGVDPKSIVCEFFRKGTCAKGFKCKFAHDLAVERKSEKIDLFSDRRETMEDWDQAELEAAIKSKEEGNNLNRPTDIICKHFLDAIEKKQYGWFWTCPNGNKECKYRHGLPPGYVMKSQIKALAAEADASKMTIEEEIEEARRKIQAATPVTEKVFLEWKRRRGEQKAAKAAELKAERLRTGRVTGRELTETAGFSFEDDELAGDSEDYRREEDVEEQIRLAQAQAETALRLAIAAGERWGPSEAPGGAGGSDGAGGSGGAGGAAGVAGLSAALASELDGLEEEEGDEEDIDFDEEEEGEEEDGEMREKKEGGEEEEDD